MASPRAVLEGVYQTEEENALGERTSPWWLRSPGTYQDSALFVETDGTVNLKGATASNDYYCGVRPVLWVHVQ